MKGLLIKDLKLMKNNGKNLLLVFLIIGTMMGIMTKELYAAVGYVTFIFTLFTVSTISYDEYDNGYPFLFTLPITRRQYVNEKYVFVLIMTAISFLVGIISVVVQFFLLTPKESLTELILMYGVYTITVLILNDIMIPLKLRSNGDCPDCCKISRNAVGNFKREVSSGCFQYRRIWDCSDCHSGGSYCYDCFVVLESADFRKKRVLNQRFDFIGEKA